MQTNSGGKHRGQEKDRKGGKGEDPTSHHQEDRSRSGGCLERAGAILLLPLDLECSYIAAAPRPDLHAAKEGKGQAGCRSTSHKQSSGRRLTFGSRCF